MGRLSEKRIRHKYDGYLAEWDFVVDGDGDLWVSKTSLNIMPSEYRCGINNIHVYGDDSWLIVDLTRSIATWAVTEISDSLVTGFMIVDEVIDE